MGTRSQINLLMPDGKYLSIESSYNGHLFNTGYNLLKYYPTYRKILNLLKLGNVESVERRIGKPVGHTEETPVKGYCVFYGRDTGSEDSAAIVSDKPIKLPYSYTYIFEDQWYVLCDNKYVPLKDFPEAVNG